MNKIIVPVDFSAAAENAAFFAAELAAFYHAELHLYNAYGTYTPVSEYAWIVTANEIHEAAAFEMEKFQENLESKLSVPPRMVTKVEEVFLQAGLPAYCDEQKPDLVVMGLSGKNAFTRLVVGSNTIYAIQHLTCPVLVVPPKANFAPVRKLGFACDYEAVIATTPVGPIKKLVKDFNAALFVLNVEAGVVVHDEKSEAAKHLKELLKECNPEYQTVISKDITAGINYFAEQTKADWLVVIPKKHNLMEKMFRRSQTSDLLHHTTMPVLCIHEE
jgi:nucleotide-binding universal stress UspA family protein